MVAVDVRFRYATPPREGQMRAIGKVWEVYGIRNIRFDEQARTVTVEYDSTRFTDALVANLLRKAGLDVEKVALR